MLIYNDAIRKRANSVIYGRDERPFGRTWEDWVIRWWRWILSIPKSLNPGFDAGSGNYRLNQSDANVLFLAGTYGGPARRHIEVPTDKAIFLPVINFITSYASEPHLKTKKDLLKRAKSDIDDITKKEVSLDDTIVFNMDEYRVSAQVFDTELIQDNVFGLQPGDTVSVTDGYWLFLKPLERGKHTLHTLGSCSLGKTSIELDFRLVVK